MLQSTDSERLGNKEHSREMITSPWDWEVEEISCVNRGQDHSRSGGVGLEGNNTEKMTGRGGFSLSCRNLVQGTLSGIYKEIPANTPDERGT